MADGQNKIRICARQGCKTRMSAIEKDSHLLCPSCTGSGCDLEHRCSVCCDWPKDKMVRYVQLQEGKARKKVYKDKQKSLKLSDGSSATTKGAVHSLSPSFSEEDDGMAVAEL